MCVCVCACVRVDGWYVCVCVCVCFFRECTKSSVHTHTHTQTYTHARTHKHTNIHTHVHTQPVQTYSTLLCHMSCRTLPGTPQLKMVVDAAILLVHLLQVGSGLCHSSRHRGIALAMLFQSIQDDSSHHH